MELKAPLFESPSASETLDSSPRVLNLLARLTYVALPSYVMNFVGMSLNLWTTGLVGHLNNTDELAAVGLGGVIVGLTGYSWLHGISGAITTLSSQSWGAGSWHAIGLNVQRSFLILLLFADLPLLLIWLSSGPLLRALGQSPEVADLVSQYTLIRAPGLPLETANAVMTKTLLAMGMMHIPFEVGVLSFILNVSLNFVLVRTHGFIGAPIAWLVADACQAIGIWILAFRSPEFRKCWPGLSRDALKEWGAFLRIACPNLFLCGIEWWTWDLLTFLSGFISPTAQATQTVAPQITGLQYATGVSQSLIHWSKPLES